MFITRLYPLGTEVRLELTRFIRTRPLPAYLGEPLHYLTVGELMINHDNWEVDFSLLFAFSLMRHWSYCFSPREFHIKLDLYFTCPCCFSKSAFSSLQSYVTLPCRSEIKRQQGPIHPHILLSDSRLIIRASFSRYTLRGVDGPCVLNNTVHSLPSLR